MNFKIKNQMNKEMMKISTNFYSIINININININNSNDY
jgi:hypothetical protein